MSYVNYEKSDYTEYNPILPNGLPERVRSWLD